MTREATLTRSDFAYWVEACVAPLNLPPQTVCRGLANIAHDLSQAPALTHLQGQSPSCLWVEPTLSDCHVDTDQEHTASATWQRQGLTVPACSTSGILTSIPVQVSTSSPLPRSQHHAKSADHAKSAFPKLRTRPRLAAMDPLVLDLKRKKPRKPNEMAHQYFLKLKETETQLGGSFGPSQNGPPSTFGT